MTMTFRPVVAGTTDVSVIIRIVDSTDGTPETTVVYNTAGIDIRYRRDGATDTAITEATLATLDAAHADGGFLHIGNGYYRVDLPDAACAAGVNGVLVHGTVTGMVVIGTYVPLFAVNPYDTVRMGLTALPNVASGSAGAIPTVGTGTAQISVTGGRAAADVTYWNGAVLTGKTGAFPEFGIVDSGTAQSYDGATDKLRLRAAFSSPDIVGCWVWIYSSTNGLHTRGIITAWDNTNKDATIDTPVQDPTGTILYVVVASPKASTSLPLPANMVQLGSDTQSATDLKDFADAGYDPATNKVQGVVLTDTVTTYTGNTPQTGDSYARIGATGSGLTSLATQASVDTIDNFLDTEIAAILALLDDPRTEPGQGTPPVNPDLATKIDYLYKAWRNRSTQTSTTYSLYADDGTTVDQKATVSDDGTTFVKGEVATGP
jgi:hypothetical protein